MNDKLLSEKQLDLITTLSRATRWRLRRIGKFPHPIKISDGRIGYLAEDIDQWIADIKSKAATAELPAADQLPLDGTTPTHRKST